MNKEQRNMKQGIRTVIFLWLILSGISSIRAQSPGDIDSLSIWIVENHYSDGYSVYWEDHKYHISGTVAIDTLEYYRILKTGRIVNMFNGDTYYYSNKYSGGLREQGNKWYKLTGDSVDVLLYDFTLNVGDTLNSCLALDSIITISNIDTLFIDGEPKKRFHLIGTGWQYIDEDYIIEDIGASTGLFEPLIFYEYWSVIHCYAIENNPLWINPEIGECNFAVNIDEYNESKSVFAYPNPFNTSTTIGFTLNGKSKIQMTIYNSIGEEVYQMENHFEQGFHTVTWSQSHLPVGIYFGVLRSEEGVSVVKMVKQK